MSGHLRLSSPTASSSLRPIIGAGSNVSHAHPVPSRFHPHFSDQHRRNVDLKIVVPDDVSSNRQCLQDAIEIQPSSSASLISLYDYEKITQLPTPVVNNGSFHSYQLDIQKRASGKTSIPIQTHSASVASLRVFSDFRPANVIRSPTDVVDVKARITSNPALLTRSSTRSIPLPPLDPDPEFLGDIYVAPHRGVTYMFDHVIGSGAFSTVVRARAINNPNDVVAVKIITVPTDDASSVSNFRLYICRELGILTHLHHPVIVKLLDYNVTLSITKDDIDQTFAAESLQTPPGQPMYDLYNMKVCNKQYFFLSHCPGGNLLQYLLRHHNTVVRLYAFWNLMERVVAELVVAIAFLHTNLVVHRDIKLENILLNKEFLLPSDNTDSPGAIINGMDMDGTDMDDMNSSPVCTLTDFGLSKKLALSTQLLATKCGSQDYVSPELLMGLKYDGMLLDLWSLGVVIYGILEDRLPFDRPPQDYVASLGVSPSVLKRRRSRHNPAHRIAMIDWDWYRTAALMKDDSVPESVKEVMTRLMRLVDVLLVRKDRRMLVADVLADERFEWIKTRVPRNFYDFMRA